MPASEETTKIRMVSCKRFRALRLSSCANARRSRSSKRSGESCTTSPRAGESRRLVDLSYRLYAIVKVLSYQEVPRIGREELIALRVIAVATIYTNGVVVKGDLHKVASCLLSLLARRTVLRVIAAPLLQIPPSTFKHRFKPTAPHTPSPEPHGPQSSPSSR